MNNAKLVVMYRSITLALFVFSLSSFALGQNGFLKDQSTKGQNNLKRVNLYHHLGSVEVPDGYQGALTSDWMDAWAGYIQMPHRNFQINWRAGLVERLSDRFEGKFIWTKDETKPNLSIKFRLARKGKNETIFATIGGLEFSASIRSESEIDLFVEIIRSYQKESCPVCRTLPRKIQRPN